MAPRFFPRPTPGDIVWCKFPEHASLKPALKSRPALVLKVGESDGATWVQVAYGTSQKVDRLYSGEFAITPSDGDAYTISGLSYPTKFNLASTFELPFNEDWFDVPPGAPQGQIPKLGVLHPGLMRRGRTAMEAAKKARN
ncbi:MAG: hypothetical protein AABM64_08235 [Pseudomonadota bacterium]